MSTLGTTAVIFDLDGTLVDSEPNYYEASRRTLAAYAAGMRCAASRSRISPHRPMIPGSLRRGCWCGVGSGSSWPGRRLSGSWGRLGRTGRAGALSGAGAWGLVAQFPAPLAALRAEGRSLPRQQVPAFRRQ